MKFLVCLLIVCSQIAFGEPPIEAETMSDNPMDEFVRWYHLESDLMGEKKAAFFTLATTTKKCVPHSCTMTAKEINLDGFAVVGNNDIATFDNLNHKAIASATFYWPNKQRQVTMLGTLKPLAEQEREKLFRKRAKGHQLTSFLHSKLAKASSHEQRVNMHQQELKEYQDTDIPLPQSFKGYHFSPISMEFFECGKDTLNSRVAYTKKKNGAWNKTQIAF